MNDEGGMGCDNQFHGGKPRIRGERWRERLSESPRVLLPLALSIERSVQQGI